MLAKLTSKNQLTLPKAAIMSVSATDYFEADQAALIQSLCEVEKGAVYELTPQFWQSVEQVVELQIITPCLN